MALVFKLSTDRYFDVPLVSLLLSAASGLRSFASVYNGVMGVMIKINVYHGSW